MERAIAVSQQLGAAVFAAARARVAWERARDAGADNTWTLANAHRESEAKARDEVERAIEAWATTLRSQGE